MAAELCRAVASSICRLPGFLSVVYLVIVRVSASACCQDVLWSRT